MTPAVLFDFNGTMFFDQRFQEDSWRRFLEPKIGRPVTEAEFQTYIHGRNMGEILAYFFSRPFSREETDVLEEEKESLYRALCLASPDFALAPGLPEFLDALRRRVFALRRPPPPSLAPGPAGSAHRSDARRVGPACRSRCSPYH